MSAVAEPLDVAADDGLARRNALVLAVAQALAGANNTVIVATAGIVGSVIAPDKSLATLPISVMIFGMWMGTLPVGLLARRFGRRFSLQTGSLCGMVAGLICCIAVLRGSFELFLLGAFCCGLYASAHQSYRFAATDTASEGFRPKAVSWVLAGGVLSGVIGPQIVIFTKDLWPPYLFAATYIAQACVAGLAGLVLMFAENSPPGRRRAGERRPPARRDRPHAAVRGGSGLRGRKLRHDEPGDDLGAARHGRVRPFGHRCDARHPVARGRACTRRASSPAR